MRTQAQGGQVLVFFAIVLPIVLLPVAAYAVDASVIEAAFARLQEVTVRAAEEAAQQVDGARLRSGAGIGLDATAAEAVARSVILTADPGATVVGISVAGTSVSVMAAEAVPVPLNFLGVPAITIHVAASARLAGGYDSPSSLLPLPFSTF